jgi:hypothetical protein
VRYREQYRRCGKGNCRRCAEGPGHCPYWYEIWREHGRLHTRYVGKVLQADAPPAVDRPDEPPAQTAAPSFAAPALEEAGARRALIAAIALRRGDVQFLRGDHADALDSVTLALRLLGEDAEHADIARAHSLIGRVACVQGAYDSAEERHGRALTIFERLGDPAGAALCWNNKGAVAWYRSDYGSGGSMSSAQSRLKGGDRRPGRHRERLEQPGIDRGQPRRHRGGGGAASAASRKRCLLCWSAYMTIAWLGRRGEPRASSRSWNVPSPREELVPRYSKWGPRGRKWRRLWRNPIVLWPRRSRLWTWPVGMVSAVRKDWRLSWPAGRT